LTLALPADSSHLSPPLTPVSSVASSFLSFSPEAPRTPRTPLSSTIGSPNGDATPKASRYDPLSELAFDPPPTRTAFRLEPPPAARRRARKPAESSAHEDAHQAQGFDLASSFGSFSSRNPFAALVGDGSGISSGSSASPSSSGASSDVTSSTAASSPLGVSASARGPTMEDDLDGAADALFLRASLGPGLSSTASSALDTSLAALGFDSEADLSSAWQDELYSSLSESSPVEPAFPPRIPRLSFQAPSPEQLRRSAGGSAGSPRRARKAATSSPRHPFGRSAAASSTASASYSPKRSPRRPSPRKSTPCDSPTRPRTLAGPACALTQTSLTSPALEAFQLDPTSPIQPHRSPPPPPKLGPFGLPLPSLSSSLIRPRTSPPKPLGPGEAARAAASAAASERAAAAQRDRRAAKSAARAERDRAAAERAARAVDGINVEELDRFFGITPRRAKAMRGGYEDVAFEEGVVGGSAGLRRRDEREQAAWREAEEFRGLLDDDLEGDTASVHVGRRADSDMSSAPSSDDESSGFDVRTRRGPPPPLFASSVSTSTSSSSRARSHSYASSTFSLDDAASALDARISLASPIDLSCTSLPSLLPSPSPSSAFCPGYRTPSPSASPYGSVDSSSSWASSQASFGPRSSSLPLKGQVK